MFKKLIVAFAHLLLFTITMSHIYSEKQSSANHLQKNQFQEERFNKIQTQTDNKALTENQLSVYTSNKRLLLPENCLLYSTQPQLQYLYYGNPLIYLIFMSPLVWLPPISNITSLATLKVSAVENRFITSSQTQSLQIIQNNNQTTFKLSLFNRSQTSKLSTFQFSNYPGLWSYTYGTKRTLSCSLIKNSVNGNYALLQFSYDQKLFKIVNTFQNGVISDSLASTLVIGQNCTLGLNNNIIYLLKKIPNTLAPVNLTNSNIKAVSSALNYIVVDNFLLKFVSSNEQYIILKTLPITPFYKIKDYKNRILVQAYSTAISGINTIFNNTFYLLLENNNALTVMSEVNYQVTLDGTQPFLSSPTLRSVLFIKDFSSFIKITDFANSKSKDVQFTYGQSPNLNFQLTKAIKSVSFSFISNLLNLKIMCLFCTFVPSHYT